MIETTQIALTPNSTAPACIVEQRHELPDALSRLGLNVPRRTVVLVGGAGGMTPANMLSLQTLFTQALAPALQAMDGALIDGGTDFGVMALMGRARAEIGGSFPLIGLAAAGTVTWPGHPGERADAAPLEPNHSGFLFVPGSDWGDESAWIAQAATAVAGPLPSVTILVNGGQIAYHDVAHSIEERRPVLVVAGSGRAADELAAAVRAKSRDKRAGDLVASGLLRVVDEIDRGGNMARLLREQLAADR